MPDRIICRVLTGPTASGKSGFALEIAARTGWDILCMDSMQIYRRMNIGTAKPTAEEQRLVPHHLLDIRDPEESFSVSEYVPEAERIIRQLHHSGREVLFVGGTGLYLQAMMMPMGMGNVPANPGLREELNLLALTEEGKRAMHSRLEKCDPDTAARLPLNDVRRVIRAIEVTEATGIPFSHQEERPAASPFEWRVVSLAMDRNTLYERINRRVSRMFRDGLEEEVRGLLSDGVPETAQSMCALGYKEMIPYIRGMITAEQAADAIRTGSRHYAKRQMTFLKRIPNIRSVDACTPDACSHIREILA